MTRTRKIVGHTFLFIAALLAVPAVLLSSDAQAPHDHDAPEGPSPTKTMSTCDTMKAYDAALEDELTRLDSKLDELVSKMSTARGQDKSRAVGDLLRQLVTHQKLVRGAIMRRSTTLMRHMATHMHRGEMKGMSAMEDCPMMREMQEEGEADEEHDHAHGT